MAATDDSPLYLLLVQERLPEDYEDEIAKLRNVDEFRGAWNRTLLLSAAASQNVHIPFVKALIDAGANVNEKDVSFDLFTIF
jgi:hypothetical protein